MVQLKPETEQLVQQEIRSSHFRSFDELIVEGVIAWREKYRVEPGCRLSKKTAQESFRSSHPTALCRF